MWSQHDDMITELLQEYTETGPLSGQNAKGLRQQLFDSYVDLQKRNEAMLFRELPTRVSGSLSSALSDIKAREHLRIL